MAKQLFWIISAVLALTLAGCGAEPQSTATPEATATLPPPTLTATESATPTSTAMPVPTETLTPQPTATATLPPLAYQRLPADRWREWAVVPTVTNRAREIYLAGIAAGRNPHHFSRIADCQGIKEVMMGYYASTSQVSFLSQEQFLMETVDWFAESFGRDGAATMGGFTVLSILDNLTTDPELCAPGELALHCELRVHNPSIAIISLEVWYPGRNLEMHEQKLREIIDYLIANHVVPILSTKADNTEGDHSINLAVARLAEEYDLSLWNFWLAVQPLPNHGMDATRNDGFHISYNAWGVRSYTALKALDSIWRGLRQYDPQW